MIIRHTRSEDLEQICQIYACARDRMRREGNPSQWGDDRPPISVLMQDIRNGCSYILEEQGRPCGVFSFIIGDDPTYQLIENGHWLNKAPYGTIHRIAGNGSVKGIFRACLSYCLSQIPNIRIDTHRDNLTMQHLLAKNGFVRCGIIHVEDGSERLAYQKDKFGVSPSDLQFPDFPSQL